MIPPFDDNGFLPPGIHICSLDELRIRFGHGSPEREVEMKELREEMRAQMATASAAQGWTEDWVEEKRKLDYVTFALTEEQKKLAGKERVEVLQKLADKANDFNQVDLLWFLVEVVSSTFSFFAMQDLRVIDGPISLLPCVSLNYYEPCEECRNEKVCGIRDAFTGVRDETLRILSRSTLAQIVKRQRELTK